MYQTGGMVLEVGAITLELQVAPPFECLLSMDEVFELLLCVPQLSGSIFLQ